MDFQIVPERPEHAALIELLLDRTFGFDRKQKTVYRLREGVAPLPDLAFVALHVDGALLGSLRFWPIRVDQYPAILLGPLAIEPVHQGRGVGRAMVAHALTSARRQGHRLCVVVGAPAYYRPFGFVSAVAHGFILPGPVDPQRFQVLELQPGALDGVRGLIGRAPQPSRPAQRTEAVGG